MILPENNTCIDIEGSQRIVENPIHVFPMNDIKLFDSRFSTEFWKDIDLVNENGLIKALTFSDELDKLEGEIILKSNGHIPPHYLI